MANPNPKPPPKHSQFKKGNRANPLGAKAHNPAIRALKKLSTEMFREVVELIHTGTLDDLKKLANDPSTPAIQVGVVVSYLKALKTGDYNVIRSVAAELIGKVPDVVQIQAQVNAQHSGQVLVIDRAELKKANDELEEEV